jgi:hypothetical protein
VQHEYTRSGVEWRDKFHRPAVTRSCGLSGRSQNRVNNGQYDAFAADLSGLLPEQLPSFFYATLFRLMQEVTMGEFAKLVKNGKIPGPHRRQFKLEDWEAFAQREDSDPEDRRLAWAGIFSMIC